MTLELRRPTMKSHPCPAPLSTSRRPKHLAVCECLGLTKQFVNTKLMTRQTYTLDGISGKLEGGGGITFTEEDGIDYAPTTVQLPGGERVPFLFTVKNLVAKADGNPGTIEPGLKLSGSFNVPSYRTGLFLDPKGRGTTTGRSSSLRPPPRQAH